MIKSLIVAVVAVIVYHAYSYFRVHVDSGGTCPRDLKMESPSGLSPQDPNSYSRPDWWLTKNITIDWDVNFDKKILDGFVELRVVKRNEAEDTGPLFLDTRDLTIIEVSDVETRNALQYTLHEPNKPFGSKLEILLPENKTELIIRIRYQTSPESSALQWLDPEMTAGKKFPYLFSQCQAIHARSMLPCQDTPAVKSTFDAKVTAPESLVVLMGALKDDSINDGKHRFHQPIPVPSYLIAVVVGALESRKISHRCSVWSEKELVDMAAKEFSETEVMLTTGEKLLGSYVWGRYDLLVLPPSFPFGGMENPCLTFVTPTLLVGDKSLASVVAHEISHSWTGNLVTNRNFEHFWLNEGFTVFIERKIIGKMFGESHRHFHAIIGWKELMDSIRTQGAENPLTSLVVNLKGVDPDDAFSTVPYEKGHSFLFYLEEKLGGADAFEKFLRSYVEKYKYTSLDTDEWKNYLMDYFKDKVSSSVLSGIDWDTWLYKPGMPPIELNFDMSLAKKCSELCDKWQNETDLSLFARSDTETMTSLQICEFLSQLLHRDPLPADKFEALTNVYSLNDTRNSEIKLRWIRLGIRSRWEKIVPYAQKFVSEQGRMKFVRPIFRDLYGWEEVRASTIDLFLSIKPQMMFVTASMVAKDLHLKSS